MRSGSPLIGGLLFDVHLEKKSYIELMLNTFSVVSEPFSSAYIADSTYRFEYVKSRR